MAIPTCRKCGSHSYKSHESSKGKVLDFQCGSEMLESTGEFDQSGICREICDLRAQVKRLEHELYMQKLHAGRFNKRL